MNSNFPPHGYLQHTPGDNQLANFFCQSSASHQVRRIFFWLCITLMIYFISLLSNGKAVGIFSTPSRSLSWPRRSPLLITPSHLPLLPRRIAGNASFARNTSPVGRSETDTNCHTSRISSTAHFRIVRGEAAVLACSGSTGRKRITAVTTSIMVAPLDGAKFRHSTRG